MKVKGYFKMHLLRMYVKCKFFLWSLIMLSILWVMGVGIYHVGRWSYRAASYAYHAYILDDMHNAYTYKTNLSDFLTFYSNGQHGYIRHINSGERILRDIKWVMGIEDKDSLLCFASKGYRGFFHRETGKVYVPANRYIRAWTFSEGLAAVMEKDCTLKFIDKTGKVIIDKHFKFAPLTHDQGYHFINGYCTIRGANQKWGLINKKGQWVVTPQYDRIKPAHNKNWICSKNNKHGVLNDSLKVIVEPQYREVVIDQHGIEVLKDDYTRQLLDFNGYIINSSVYVDIQPLYCKEVSNPDSIEYKYTRIPFFMYQTTHTHSGIIKVGLMSSDGKPITPPIYRSIEAINKNLFRCYYEDPEQYYEGEGVSVIINKEGQIVQ